jgi:hypothetical protein
MEIPDTAGDCIAGSMLATTQLGRALAGEARRGEQEKRDEQGTEAAEVEVDWWGSTGQWDSSCLGKELQTWHKKTD